MSKKYKIFVCLLILLGISLSFVPSVFASTDALNFTGFDGNDYSIPVLPDELVNSYSSFVIAYISNFSYEVIFFDNVLNIEPSSDSIVVSTDYEGRFMSKLRWNEYEESWLDEGTGFGFSYSLNDTFFIYSSNDLLEYGSEINSSSGFTYNSSSICDSSGDSTGDSSSGFVYTDVNGKVFYLPAYPEELKEYNHYVLFKPLLVDDFYLLPFNDTFEVVDNTDHSFNVLIDGHSFDFFWYCFLLNGEMMPWSTSGSAGGGTNIAFSKTNNHYYVVDTCPCLKPYANNLESVIENNESFFMSRQEVLVPIMERAPLAEVMREIMIIFPVVLVTLVGLIGLRKALQMLSAVFRRS